MSLQGRPNAVLSTIVVAGLAAGLGFGVHAVIGKADVGASPSSSPSSSPSASPSPSNVALGDDFCALMEEMVVYLDQMDDSMQGTILILDGGESSDPEVIDQLHEFGRAIIDSRGTVSDYMLRGAELVTDPEVAAEFVSYAQVNELLGEAMGNLALEATTVADYGNGFLSRMNDPEFVTMIDEADAAEMILGQYVLETCGIDLSGATPDDNLKAEVSTLGKEIATYFVDWDGHTQPEMTVAGGEYYLNGVDIGTQTPGVALTDQYANGPTDWCVEVTSEEDLAVVYTYTAQAGLAQGTCASLRP